jgi:predicted nucleic-acid-binding protein
MKSVDTNVLARYVIGDDPAQAALATEILRQPCFISHTVLLETAWLLASRYRVARADLADTLLDLVHLPRVSVSDLALVEWAIARFAAGGDFADMLHIAGSGGADAFVSLEKRLADRAGAQSPVPVEQLA